MTIEAKRFGVSEANKTYYKFVDVYCTYNISNNGLVHSTKGNLFMHFFEGVFLLLGMEDFFCLFFH